MKNFDQIKTIAVSKNLRMADVAIAAGITYQQLNRIMRTGQTTLDTLERIAAALGLPTTFFLEEGESEVIASAPSQRECEQNPLLSRAFDEMAAQRKFIDRAQSQLDEVISIIKHCVMPSTASALP